MSLLAQMIAFLREPINYFGPYSAATVELSVLATVIAVLVAVPLGILSSRIAVVSFLATNVTGLARAVPTLAFVAAVYAILHQDGFVPALLSLILLGIPPILLNTVAGLRGIDPAITDAARGMGMTPLQMLGRIQVPLVLPVVAAGVRTAAVQIVATVPIASLIGVGTWGAYVFEGGPYGTLLIPLLDGVVLIALFALLVEVVLAGVQRAVTPVGLRAARMPQGERAAVAAADASQREPVAV